MSLTILRNATVFDGHSDDLIPDCDIVIEGDTIREVTSGRSGLTADIEIDASGKTLLPGLIDAHVHLFAAHLSMAQCAHYPMTLMTLKCLARTKNMVERGFTTVRDVGGGDFGMRQGLAEGLIPGPRAFIGGPGLTQTGGHGDHRMKTDEDLVRNRYANGHEFTHRLVDGTEQMRQVVRDELRKGADHIKLMASGGVGSPNDAIEDWQFSEAEIRTAVEEAEAKGKYVAAHTYASTAVQRAVKNGVRTVEHCNLIDRETAAVVRDCNAFVVPTLVCYEVTKIHGDKLGLSPYVMQKLDEVNEGGIHLLEHCEAEGTPMGFGTDLMGEMEYAQSMEFVIRARVQKPVDVIRSATSVNAKILQMEGKLGCIAEGALADIILVDGNPLEDITLLDGQGENIPFIMQSGKVYRNRMN
ncbi:amidohydrolase family protein [Psychromarinibacter sp. S121]|uniref:metal-dependent hydrolase family protein n=1 Tax=Psychromarinibacter sp. S121 TaxID=3415127 RepID=UPI003C79E6C5